MPEPRADIEVIPLKEIDLARQELDALIKSHAIDALDGIIERLQEQGITNYARDIELITSNPLQVAPALQDLIKAYGLEVGINAFTQQEQAIQDLTPTINLRLLLHPRSVPHAHRWRLSSKKDTLGYTDPEVNKLRVAEDYTIDLTKITTDVTQDQQDERGTQYNAITIKAQPTIGNHVDLFIRPEIATTFKKGDSTNVPTTGILIPGAPEIRLNKMGWKNQKQVQDAIITAYNFAKVLPRS